MSAFRLLLPPAGGGGMRMVLMCTCTRLDNISVERVLYNRSRNLCVFAAVLLTEAGGVI
jgi:hypothetical protein